MLLMTPVALFLRYGFLPSLLFIRTSVGIFPQLDTTYTSVISPTQPDIEIQAAVPLSSSETLESVSWYREGNVTEPLAVYNTRILPSDETRADIRYRADVKHSEETTLLSLFILESLSSANVLEHEGRYLACVQLAYTASPVTSVPGVPALNVTGAPAITTYNTTYSVQLTVQVATRLKMEFTPVRSVGEKATVTCTAKGWKPPAQFLKLRKYGDRFETGASFGEYEMSVTEEQMRSGVTDTVANFTFIVKNTDRGVMVACLAWSSATGGASSPLSTHYVFNENDIYKPIIGDVCLWPPNVRSQCEREDIKGIGCDFGTCRALYNKLCMYDEECGHILISRLQCINNRCLCDSRSFDFVWHEPYCNLRIGTVCGPGNPCTSYQTACLDGVCRCDASLSRPVTFSSRGQSFKGCEDYLDARCREDADCYSTEESNLLCSNGRCACPAGFTMQTNECLEGGNAGQLNQAQRASPNKLDTPTMTITVVGVICALCVVGFIIILVAGARDDSARREMTLRRKLYLGLITRLSRTSNTGSKAAHKEFYDLVNKMPPESPKGMNRNTRSLTNKILSRQTLASFSSEGKPKIVVQDFGESASDALHKFIEERRQENMTEKAKEVQDTAQTQTKVQTKTRAKPQAKQVTLTVPPDLGLRLENTGQRGKTKNPQTKKENQDSTTAKNEQRIKMKIKPKKSVNKTGVNQD